MESCWSASRALLSMWIQCSALGCFTSLAEGAADNSNRYLSAFHLSAPLPAPLCEHFSISLYKSDTVSLEFVIKTCSVFYCCTNSKNPNQKSVSYSPPSSFPASFFHVICSLSSIQSLSIYLTGVMLMIMDIECTVPTLHTNTHMDMCSVWDITQVHPIKAHKYTVHESIIL